MFACALYPAGQGFVDSVRAEVAYQVRYHCSKKEDAYVAVLPFVKPLLLTFCFLFTKSHEKPQSGN